MSSFVIIVILVAIVVLLLAAAAAIRFALRPPSELAAAGRYSRRAAIFTPAERSFLGVMDGVLPDGVSWLGKVRLGDVFVPRKGLSNSERTSARNRINQKHVDFLLVRVSDFAPLAGIELDDSSHEADDRKARDAFVDDVFRSANLPLLHVPAQASYSPGALKIELSKLVSSSGMAILQGKSPE